MYKAIAAEVHQKIEEAIESGFEVLQDETRVDTSSLRSSAAAIVPSAQSMERSLKREATAIEAFLQYGGEDFTGQTMPDTGKPGKRVTYVKDQEEKTNALLNAGRAIEDEWRKS